MQEAKTDKNMRSKSNNTKVTSVQKDQQKQITVRRAGTKYQHKIQHKHQNIVFTVREKIVVFVLKNTTHPHTKKRASKFV